MASSGSVPLGAGVRPYRSRVSSARSNRAHAHTSKPQERCSAQAQVRGANISAQIGNTKRTRSSHNALRRSSERQEFGVHRASGFCLHIYERSGRSSFSVRCVATNKNSSSYASTDPEPLDSSNGAIAVANRGKPKQRSELLSSLSSAGKSLLLNLAQSGSKASSALSFSSREALQKLVGGLMTDIVGMRVDIRGDLRILGGNALMLSDVRVGDEMYVKKILLRAQLEPLLAVLKSWRDTPAGSEAPPILVQSISVRGVKCRCVDVHGILRAYSIFRDAPGAISLGRLSLANVQAEMAHHNDKGEPVEYSLLHGVDGKEQKGGARTVFIRRMEFKAFNSRMSLADMSGSISLYSEHPNLANPRKMLADPKAVALLPEESSARSVRPASPISPTQSVLQSEMFVPPEPRTTQEKLRARGLDLFNQVKQGRGLDLLPQRAREWVPPAVSNRVNDQLQTTIQNLSPLVEGRMAGLLAESLQSLGTAVNLGDAAIDTWRAAAGTEALIDAGLVLALLAQGLPRWFMTRKGGKLMAKMVETGVAAALLTQGNLLKIMVNKQLLEQMLELGLLEQVLQRDDLTKELIRQGVLRDILERNVIDAMVKPDNVPVLFQLLEGEMLEVMVTTNVLSALKVHSK